MRGKYQFNMKYPYTPGWEGSGTVVEVGPGLLGQLFLNKRVAFTKIWELGTLNYGGAFADYCLTDVKCVVPLTEDINMEQAASSIINPMTAVGMIDRCIQLKAKAIIITAAAS